MESATSATAAKQNVLAAIDEVAESLGNTRAVCRKCYVHPVVLETYAGGQLLEALPAAAMFAATSRNGHGLSRAERAVAALLRRGTRRSPAERKIA